jgi:hypothetical protein
MNPPAESASARGNLVQPGPASYDDELDLQIARIESRLRTSRTRWRTGAVSISAAGGLAILFALFAKQLLPQGLYGTNGSLISFGVGTYTILAVMVGIVLQKSKEGSVILELDELKAKKRILLRLPAEASESAETASYFDRLVNINVSNLEAYYRLVKVHTNNSFQVSLVVGCIGFVLIVTGLIFGFAGIGHSESIAYISAGSGVVTEFIASVFFYLYNRTVRQLKEYHDSLLAVQNILLSFKIVGDTRDENRKNIMMENMIDRLVGQNVPGGESLTDVKSTRAKRRKNPKT